MKPWRNKAEKFARKIRHQNPLRNSPAIFLQFASPKEKNHPKSALHNLGIKRLTCSNEIEFSSTIENFKRDWIFQEFPNLVVSNLVVCNSYADALFCALLRAFALFCGLAFALFCAHLWGVAKGSSISWVAKFKGDKNSECKLSNGWSRSYGETKPLLSARNEWSRSYKEINQHPHIP